LMVRWAERNAERNQTRVSSVWWWDRRRPAFTWCRVDQVAPLVPKFIWNWVN